MHLPLSVISFSSGIHKQMTLDVHLSGISTSFISMMVKDVSFFFSFLIMD